MDAYDVPVPVDLPMAEAEVWVGLYNYTTGAGLVTGETDHLRLALSAAAN